MFNTGNLASNVTPLPGPHGIGTRIAYNNTPLKPGMTVSNGPRQFDSTVSNMR